MELITIDTNIISKALDGNLNALNVIQGNITYVSFIVRIELLSAPHYTKKDIPIIRQALNQFFTHSYSQSLEEIVIKIRKTYKLKTPDAIIAATALDLRLPLFSNDTIFGKIADLNFIHVQF